MTASRPGSLASGDLFQLLRDGGGRTRSELAELTGLARSTIAARVDELIASGLVASAGEARSSGGRPPTRFAFDPHSPGGAGRRSRGDPRDLSRSPISAPSRSAKSTEPIEIADGPEAVLTRLREIWSTMLDGAGRTRRRCRRCRHRSSGAGRVRHRATRAIRRSCRAGTASTSPAFIGEYVDAPVLVDNDVNLMALGEFDEGWRDERHLLFVKIATGIGAGIVADGRLNRGAQGSAGDLGHVGPTATRTVECTCGNVGCLEAVAAGPAIAARLRARGLAGRFDRRRGRPGPDRQPCRPAGSSAGRSGNRRRPGHLRQPAESVGDRDRRADWPMPASTCWPESARSSITAPRRWRPSTCGSRRATPASRAGVRGASAMVIQAVLSPESVDALLERRALLTAAH